MLTAAVRACGIGQNAPRSGTRPVQTISLWLKHSYAILGRVPILAGLSIEMVTSSVSLPGEGYLKQPKIYPTSDIVLLSCLSRQGLLKDKTAVKNA